MCDCKTECLCVYVVARQRVCLYVVVRVCVREIEREREMRVGGKMVRGCRETALVCVCVYVCVRERRGKERKAVAVCVCLFVLEGGRHY